MDDLQRRIAEGVALLRARFGKRMRATPSLADPEPLGSGPRNRHGMPRLPKNQSAEEELLPMDIGEEPQISHERWRLVVDGAVESPLALSWQELLALPQIRQVCDFHCVTGWTVLDLPWKGVRLETVAALARPTAEATHVMLHGSDSYSTNLPLEEALRRPHTRGGGPYHSWSDGQVIGVVPTRVGVDRWSVSSSDRSGRRPHTRGGGPG